MVRCDEGNRLSFCVWRINKKCSTDSERLRDRRSLHLLRGPQNWLRCSLHPTALLPVAKLLRAA